MKGISIELCCVLFACIALGHAFIGLQTGVISKVVDCANANIFKTSSEYPCYDNAKVLECYGKITPHTYIDHYQLKEEVNKVKKEMKECPGFIKDVGACKGSIVHFCKGDFRHKKDYGDDTVCGELEEVRTCLQSKLNGSCTAHAIRMEIVEVDQLDLRCQSGDFKSGPCTKGSIIGCGSPVCPQCEHDGICNKTLLDEAKQCYSTKEKLCDDFGPSWQIKSEKEQLLNNCNRLEAMRKERERIDKLFHHG